MVNICMRRSLIVVGVLLAAIGMAAAQQTEVESNPGMITAESPFYVVDVALDNAAVDVGLKPPGDVVHERASEALAAADQNDTESVDRALNEMNRVAQAATANDTAGLEKAQAVLEAVIERTPDDAGVGVETALEQIERAQNRVPDAQPGNAGQPAEGM